MDIPHGYNLFQEYQAELKNKNRFFPDGKYCRLFDEIICSDNIVTLPPGHILYRGRKNKPNAHFENVSEIGLNKTAFATNRASPVGIPYMYLAGDVDTVVAELRANVKQTVTVGSFRTKKDLRLLSLNNNSTHCQREGSQYFSLDITGFTLFLSLAFSEPIRYQAELDYLPCQYFAEYCKKKGLSGIRYISSARGFRTDQGSYHYNFVIFDENDVEFVGAHEFEVESIAYKISKPTPIHLK